eukprot:TRINITY_DN705_c0_g1_i22.p1 TRINITY_DN705_c0_g1~~TRINITY_DN705_c0_g1_i22.p1  ORF type:complete len:404 (+),score=44.30 TRINITY_DN705_c0_g1_i22:50-1213(+)
MHKFLLLIFLPYLFAVTYTVGPNRTQKTLSSSFLNTLKPGDRVEVDQASYAGGVQFVKSGNSTHPITIVGIKNGSGARPLFSGGTNTIQFELANWNVLESFEITGGTSRCVFNHAANTVLRDLKIHDCPKQGLLGADTESGSLTLEYSEIYRCGSGTSNHQIYMATNEVQFPGSVFRMRYNYIHDALGGNNVKSRAERNEIYFNWIEGAMYHELELIGPDPAGGVSENQAREDSDVVGNVLKKVGTSFVARLGGDGTGQSKGRYRFVSNTILMNTGGGAAFRLFDGIQSFEAHNNIVYSPSTNSVIIRTAEAVWTNGVQISGTNNWVRTGYLNTADGRSTINGWTNTVIGTSPGFVNLASNDLRLAAEIGRAVQQECRDRSRMPSSA